MTRAQMCLFGLALLMDSRDAGAAPLQYLSGAGDKADPVVALTWGVLIVSLSVIAIIVALLAGAIWHRPGLAPAAPNAKAPLGDPQTGLDWLWIGVGVSTLVLLFTVVWTMQVLARIEAPGARPAVTIEVTGRQWWWQARYQSADPSRIFNTANEIHIPAGQPVRLKLVGGDVIHSFWVPQLAGKMDAIPGQTNETWIEARAPGNYRGQCTEYCGLQHAHMGLVVIAQSPSDFRRWWDHQLQSPGPARLRGEESFVTHCGACHAVRGTDAAGVLGPDLSHLKQRTTIAAGALANNGPSLAHWISDPQDVKPGSLMPAPELSPSELADIQAWLNTLR
jgi:cytochrome c oxidase subunit 2